MITIELENLEELIEGRRVEIPNTYDAALETVKSMVYNASCMMREARRNGLFKCKVFAAETLRELEDAYIILAAALPMGYEVEVNANKYSKGGDVTISWDTWNHVIFTKKEKE